MATAKKPLPIGAIVDQLYAVREEKRALAVKEKELDEKVAALEAQLYEACDAQQTTGARGSKASITIGESQVFNIVDFDALAKYIKRTGYFHLFQRRITLDAARELFEKNGQVPGLESFTKRKINLTTLK